MTHILGHMDQMTELKESLERVMAPIEAARGLPNALYVDETVYQEECQRLLQGGWACLGFSHDIDNPGDQVPVDFAGLPLLMLRGKENDLRVFHNVCPHRGRQLLDQSVSGRLAVTCPYHRWSFKTDGTLVKAPHVGGMDQHTCPGFDAANARLKEVRSAEWMGLIFIDVSGTAEPFEHYMAPVSARWAEFQRTPVVHGGTDSSLTMEVACNWKLAVENYCEAYHLPWVHPDLNKYSPLDQHTAIVGTTISGQISSNYNPQFPDGAAPFPNAPGLSAYWNTGAEYLSLFPNVLLGIHRDHFFAVLVTPKGPARSVERLEVFYFDETVRNDSYQKSRETNTKLWETVFLEDQDSVEGLQRGRHSPAYDGGIFSPVMDPPTLAFHQWVAAAWLYGRGRTEDLTLTAGDNIHDLSDT